MSFIILSVFYCYGHFLGLCYISFYLSSKLVCLSLMARLIFEGKAGAYMGGGAHKGKLLKLPY